jgi:hypothetical protein
MGRFKQWCEAVCADDKCKTHWINNLTDSSCPVPTQAEMLSSRAMRVAVKSAGMQSVCAETFK